MKEERGRKSNKLSHRIHTRVTADKYGELEQLMKQSRGIRCMSELLRNILENKKIVVKNYDVTYDKVMNELSGIRSELHAIGININQITHHFHIQDHPEGRLFDALEIVKLYQQTDLKVSELLTVIAKLSDKWLPE